MQYRLDELGVKYELITLATSSHVAHDEQLAQVESVIMRGVDYVMLGPTAFDACVPALKALKESIDEEPTKENIRLAYIKSDTKKFHMASKEEIEGFLANLE